LTCAPDTAPNAQITTARVNAWARATCTASPRAAALATVPAAAPKNTRKNVPISSAARRMEIAERMGSL
jgi:hypothetical protein